MMRRLNPKLVRAFEEAAIKPPNPRLARAFEETAVEPPVGPLDYDTPGKLIVLPGAEPPAPTPKSRLDMVREYLERSRGPEVVPDFGPEPDVAAAREADAVQDFRGGMLAAGQAFTGNRAAVGRVQSSTTNEDRALGAAAARRKALADWASQQERRRLDEADVLSRSAAEPGKKDPALERERLDIERQRIEQQGVLGERKMDLAEEKLRTPKPKKPEDPSALRKEFNALPEVKQFQEVDASFKKIQAAAQNVSAAGDLSLIFSYMKMLDPGSTVREGEFANAQNAGGVDDKLQAAYNNVLAGQRLTEAQRADFLAQAGRLYEAQRQQYSASAKRYQGFATKKGLTPEDVAVDASPIETRSGPDASAGSPPPGKVFVVDIATGKRIPLSKAAADAAIKAGKARAP